MNCICQLDIRFRKDFGTPKSMKYRFHALFDTSVPIKIDPPDQLLICNAKKAFLSRFLPPEMLFVAFPVCTGSNRPLLLIIVYPNEGGVAGHGNRTEVKYTAKWGLQIAEMIFQTRSSNLKAPKSMIFCPLVSLYCIWIVQEKCSKKCQRHIDSRLPFSFSHCN